jgi:anti-anti-sigma factor
VGNLVFEVAVGEFDPPRPDFEEDAEEDSPASVLAGQILERSRRRADTPPPAPAGRRLRVEMLEGVPVASIELWKIADSEAVAAFAKDLRRVAEQPGVNRLILDFRKVRVISAEAAEVLAGVLGRMRARGAELKLCDVAPEVMRVLEDQGLTTRVFIGFDPHDALWSTW